jgi:hypothetical protein
MGAPTLIASQFLCRWRAIATLGCPCAPRTAADGGRATYGPWAAQIATRSVTPAERSAEAIGFPTYR